MTKDKYLQKLSFARSEIHLLITCTFAGANRVLLEEIHDDLVELRENIEKMSEEQFKQWVAA